jgi:hypothetical protein
MIEESVSSLRRRYCSEKAIPLLAIFQKKIAKLCLVILGMK